VVFAADEQNKNTGYALAPSEVVSLIASKAKDVETIDTGTCAKAK
jgi:hypothetical protein